MNGHLVLEIRLMPLPQFQEHQSPACVGGGVGIGIEPQRLVKRGERFVPVFFLRVDITDVDMPEWIPRLELNHLFQVTQRFV
jgi:hypothetical protein